MVEVTADTKIEVWHLHNVCYENEHTHKYILSEQQKVLSHVLVFGQLFEMTRQIFFLNDRQVRSSSTDMSNE